MRGEEGEGKIVNRGRQETRGKSFLFFFYFYYLFTFFFYSIRSRNKRTKLKQGEDKEELLSLV